MKIKQIYLYGCHEDKFWKKVDIKGKDECWEWLGEKNLKGYGKFRYFNIFYGAHRVAYAIAHKYVFPEENLILHKCDNPSCVNPNHLYCGTQTDNAQDRSNRSNVSWENCKGPGTKRKANYTSNDVLAIKKLYKDGCIAKEIAEVFGIGKGTVYHIVHDRIKRFSDSPN